MTERAKLFRPLATTLVTLAALSLPLLGAGVVEGCKSKDPEKKPEPDSAPAASPSASTSASAPALDASAPDASADAGDGAAASRVGVPFVGDAGAASCKVLYGPTEMPFRGTAALGQEGARLSVVANDSGRPRDFGFPVPPLSPPVPPQRTLSFEPMSYPPCELAGKATYCVGRGGAVKRFLQGAERELAKGRPSTRIAAAPLGEGHSLVAYLVEKVTSEGLTIQANVVLDDGEPVRLSEEGSGATQLALVPAGEKVVALYLDARTAMTPVHARELTVKDGKLVLGTDAVLTVGGPAERGVMLAAGRRDNDVFALVPMPSDVTAFGMTTLKVPSPPKEDVASKLSPYLNGIDPAPIAASRSGARVYIARVVPEGPEVGAPRALELGHLAPDTSFVSHGLVARGVRITDVSVHEDTAHTAWVLYGDAAHTWLSRFSCP